jgi:hypothetical protein
MTHADLCALAVRWLRRPNSAKGHGCIFAVSEARPEVDGECPDAIGFRVGHNDGSVLVECKVSRADFLADRAKPHRQNGKGMGTWRYYMAPDGIITPDDLPPRWGLLLVNARGHVKPVAGPAAAAGDYRAFQEALAAYRHADVDVERERALLVRLLARLGDVEAMNLRIREAVAAQQRMAVKLEKAEAAERAAKQELWASKFAAQQSLPTSPESALATQHQEPPHDHRD